MKLNYDLSSTAIFMYNMMNGLKASLHENGEDTEEALKSIEDAYNRIEKAMKDLYIEEEFMTYTMQHRGDE